MSQVSCPNGHLSSADDYCDVCGTPIEQGSGAAVTPGPGGPGGGSTPNGGVGGGGGTGSGTGGAGGRTSGAGSGPEVCPHCATDNAPGAFFCEACGYDFTTGVLPRDQTDPREAARKLLAEQQKGTQVNEPAEGESHGDGSQGGSQSDGSEGGGAQGDGSQGDGSQGGQGAGGQGAGGPGTGSDPGWVAEVWVDPDWYTTQEAEDPCPSPGLPLIVPLRGRQALIGRPSASRNIVPDVDLSADPGVSRRHASLTTDGKRWFIEDLDSSNGTFVGAASGGLPSAAIPVGPKRELSDDDRVYVGAWTRIVVREAAPGELDGIT